MEAAGGHLSLWLCCYVAVWLCGFVAMWLFGYMTMVSVPARVSHMGAIWVSLRIILGPKQVVSDMGTLD